ncbi:hypothetical protein [Pseudomonas sp. microsymbiont 2]
MKNSDQVRAQFEAWFIREFYEGDRSTGLEWLSTEPCGSYRHSQPAEAWRIWQASRESLVITNPFELIIGDPDGQWAHEVAEKSLRAQGLKVVG